MLYRTRAFYSCNWCKIRILLFLWAFHTSCKMVVFALEVPKGRFYISYSLLFPALHCKTGILADIRVPSLFPINSTAFYPLFLSPCSILSTTSVPVWFQQFFLPHLFLFRFDNSLCKAGISFQFSHISYHIQNLTFTSYNRNTLLCSGNGSI